jgi:anti-sigma28 factor (negative regulator of flagellin synthesis)
MKRYICLIGGAALVVMAVASACGKKTDSATARVTAAVDIAPLQQSFQSADPFVTNRVNKIIFAIESGSYEAAAMDLRILASFPGLTPEQQQAIRSTFEQLETAKQSLPKP